MILYGAYLFDFLLKIILLSKFDSMTQLECQCQKPFRNHSLQKIAPIHHENLRKRPNCHHFYIAYLLDFLLDFLKLKMKTTSIFRIEIVTPTF